MAVNAVRFLGTGADDTALALKMYLGSFAEAPRSSIFMYDTGLPVIQRKTVTSGKSWQFLMPADVPDAEDFTPGNELLGQAYAVDEGTITVDNYLVAHKFVPRDQMKIAHFDILPQLAKSHKSILGRRYDRRVMTIAALAARAAASTKNGLTVHNGGNRVTRTGGSVAAAYPLSATGAANFRADLRQLARQMDEDNIPPEGRYLLMQPYMRQVLLFDAVAAAAQPFSSLFSRDYQSGGNEANLRKIIEVEGFQVLGFPNTTTNNGPLPDQNLTAEALTKYQGNFTVQASNGTPVAIALCAGEQGEAPVGLVTFEDVQSVVQYYPEKMAWLVMSFTLCGAGQLHPWTAGSVEAIT